jgi:hypothetical protein
MKPLKPRQERFCRRFAEFGCAAASVPAAPRNDDFCYAEKLF